MKNISVCSVETKRINNEISFKTKISKLEKSFLIQLPNLKHRAMQITINICEISTLNTVRSTCFRYKRKTKKVNK